MPTTSQPVRPLTLGELPDKTAGYVDSKEQSIWIDHITARVNELDFTPGVMSIPSEEQLPSPKSVQAYPSEVEDFQSSFLRLADAGDIERITRLYPKSPLGPFKQYLLANHLTLFMIDHNTALENLLAQVSDVTMQQNVLEEKIRQAQNEMKDLALEQRSLIEKEKHFDEIGAWFFEYDKLAIQQKELAAKRDAQAQHIKVQQDMLALMQLHIRELSRQAMPLYDKSMQILNFVRTHIPEHYTHMQQQTLTLNPKLSELYHDDVIALYHHFDHLNEQSSLEQMHAMTENLNATMLDSLIHLTASQSHQANDKLLFTLLINSDSDTWARFDDKMQAYLSRHDVKSKLLTQLKNYYQSQDQLNSHDQQILSQSQSRHTALGQALGRHENFFWRFLDTCGIWHTKTNEIKALDTLQSTLQTTPGR